MATNEWFSVDKEGLSKLLEGNDAATRLLLELVQNSLDTDTTKVEVELVPVPGKSLATLRVSDDHPDGFTDLTHAYRLFAESEKKDDPTKRGRFNLGEKLVLSLCTEATITSTKGGVRFNADGTRTTLRKKRDAGSVFEATIKMTREQVADALENARNIIASVPVFLNGEEIPARKSVAEFEVTLPTMTAGDDGVLKRTNRKTAVSAYEVRGDANAQIFELGIPVVETGDKFDIDIQQKVPVNMDRDNVPPAYLRKVRVAVLNHLHETLDSEDANATWVQDASSSKDVAAAAFTKVMDERFGKDRVGFDPNDREACARAVNSGATVIGGRSLSSEQWANAKRFGSVVTAGKSTFATHKDGEPEDISDKQIGDSDWTDGMKFVKSLTEAICLEAHGFKCAVWVIRSEKRSMQACYGSSTVSFNLNSLGRKWFDGDIRALVDLITHELAHDKAPNHFSDEFYNECTRIAGAAVSLALTNPAIFKRGEEK